MADDTKTLSASDDSIVAAATSRETPEIHLVPPTQTAHGAEIRDITRNSEVMKWVANGKAWGNQKFERFFGYCAEEETQSLDKRVNYYHAVMIDGTCVGLVGIHPLSHDRSVRGRPTLTIFLSPQITGRGVGTRAIEAALASFWRLNPETTVIIDVRADNFPMLRVAEKMGLFRMGSPRFSGHHYRRFEAVPPRR